VRTRSWLAVLAIALAGAGCTPMDNLLASIFGRSMRDQPSIGPYQDLRLPPPGSVPFAAGNFPVGPGVVNLGQPEGSEIPAPFTNIQVAQALANPDGFPEITGLVNPVEPTPASLARGEEMFNRSCVPCHGPAGAGDGLVAEVAPIFGFSLLGEQTRALSDSYIYAIIRVGRGGMPAFGHQITHYDRWHVVNYLRQLQGQ